MNSGAGSPCGSKPSRRSPSAPVSDPGTVDRERAGRQPALPELDNSRPNSRTPRLPVARAPPLRSPRIRRRRSRRRSGIWSRSAGRRGSTTSPNRPGGSWTTAPARVAVGAARSAGPRSGLRRGRTRARPCGRGCYRARFPARPEIPGAELSGLAHSPDVRLDGHARAQLPHHRSAQGRPGPLRPRLGRCDPRRRAHRARGLHRGRGRAGAPNGVRARRRPPVPPWCGRQRDAERPRDRNGRVRHRHDRRRHRARVPPSTTR